MSRIRTLLTNIALGLAVAVGAIVGATAITGPSASAVSGTPHCVTRTEYRQIHRRDTLPRAKRVWGRPWRTMSYGSQGTEVSWSACNDPNLLVSGLFRRSGGIWRMVDKMPYPAAGSGEHEG